jgi:hypothetical protein
VKPAALDAKDTQRNVTEQEGAVTEAYYIIPSPKEAYL